MYSNEAVPDILRLYLGRPYRYSRGGLYAPLGFVYHGRSDTDMVHYVGLDGRDKGRHYVCETCDWERKFVLVEESTGSSELVPATAPRGAGHPTPVQKRIAGKFKAGSGV